MELIDEQGLEACNLRAVAARLGVKAPSLYKHFHNKADLLAEVAHELIFQTRLPASKSDDWREFVVQLALATRRMLLRHARAALLILQYFPRETLLAQYERSIRGYGAAPEHHLMITEGVEKFTYGSALFAAASIAQDKPAMPHFDRTRFPYLDRAVKANPHDEETLFVQTLRHFLDGVPDAPAAQTASDSPDEAR